MPRLPSALPDLVGGCLALHHRLERVHLDTIRLVLDSLCLENSAESLRVQARSLRPLLRNTLVHTGLLQHRSGIHL